MVLWPPPFFPPRPFSLPMSLLYLPTFCLLTGLAQPPSWSQPWTFSLQSGFGDASISIAIACCLNLFLGVKTWGPDVYRAWLRHDPLPLKVSFFNVALSGLRYVCCWLLSPSGTFELSCMLSVSRTSFLFYLIIYCMSPGHNFALARDSLNRLSNYSSLKPGLARWKTEFGQLWHSLLSPCLVSLILLLTPKTHLHHAIYIFKVSHTWYTVFKHIITFNLYKNLVR